MTLYGALLLLLYFIIRTDSSIASDCSIYRNGDALNVPEGTECTLAADLSVSGNMEVYGNMKITTGTLVRIHATSISIEPGGKIYADAVASDGTGQGDSHGSGGGYGGRGGSPANSFLTSSASIAYGSFAEPLQAGSRGGGSNGGFGGGAIFLSATVSVNITGILSAVSYSGGGGSGGSVYIDTDTIYGSGVISARGGGGGGDGGGGGGGRITLKHRTMSNSIQLFADGAIGGNDVMLLKHTSMTASSNQSYYGASSYGYISQSTKSWRPNTNANAFLEMRLDDSYYVTAIETRGGDSSQHYVKTYTVKYYNSSSWHTLGDANYEFTGNANSGSTVRVLLPRPLYASRIRLYPKTWNVGIELSFKVYGYAKDTSVATAGVCAAPSKAGSGGPGTMFYWQKDTSSTLVVNNYGKASYIKTRADCSGLDVLTQGAAAYVLDTATINITDVVIYEESHVVFKANQDVGDIISDQRSMIHVEDNIRLTIQNKLTSHALISTGSSMEFLAASDVEISSTLYVNGAISFRPNQTLTLDKLSSMSINSTSMTDISCNKIRIINGGELSIHNENSVFF